VTNSTEIAEDSTERSGVEPVLSVRGLTASYELKDAHIRAVRNVSFELLPGETLALVGESACGKSSVALSVLGLLPRNAGIESGTVEYRGESLVDADPKRLRRLRGSEIAMIFQDAQSSLTPNIRVRDQVAEVFQSHGDMSSKEAGERAVDTLARFLPDAAAVADSFPFQLSGGMAQRVMIAMATALGPKVIVADEPTASLDAAIRHETMSFLEEMRDDRGVAVLLITHDFGVVARLADRVAVMYAGEIIETADVRTIFRAPKHPYTFGLLSSIPSLNLHRDRLTSMRGQPPDLANLPEECAFLPRCSKATLQCRGEVAPTLGRADDSSDPRHLAACYNQIAVPLRQD